MILSFSCKDTERLFHNESVYKWRAFESTARRKLKMLNAAHDIIDLKIPPGNRLEKLHLKKQEWWSIRINAQMRICFRWKNDAAQDVHITDYHS